MRETFTIDAVSPSFFYATLESEGLPYVFIARDIGCDAVKTPAQMIAGRMFAEADRLSSAIPWSRA